MIIYGYKQIQPLAQASNTPEDQVGLYLTGDILDLFLADCESFLGWNGHAERIQRTYDGPEASLLRGKDHVSSPPNRPATKTADKSGVTDHGEMTALVFPPPFTLIEVRRRPKFNSSMASTRKKRRPKEENQQVIIYRSKPAPRPKKRTDAEKEKKALIGKFGPCISCYNSHI